MKLLLDTHVAIWAATTPERIPAKVQDLIAANAGSVSVSVASIWEIAIKHQLRREGEMPFSGQQTIIEFQLTGFDLLEVRAAHAAFVERLPILHADPFDRLLLAQSIIEGAHFVTRDRQLSRYDANIVTW